MWWIILGGCVLAYWIGVACTTAWAHCVYVPTDYLWDGWLRGGKEQENSECLAVGLLWPFFVAFGVVYGIAAMLFATVAWPGVLIGCLFNRGKGR